MNWEVSRRFSDFEWLREQLKKLFPGNYIPPLSKKTKVKHFDETHLNKRLRVFENFINYILKSKILSYTTYVSDFLSINEDGLFSARKRDGENKKAP